ncbi:hypothetical protein [Pendulispora albinea]|uniref:Lipoprotein n=1 Tax=Pendulispora albinea TaxID=2741071 RepID=A0ABZ2LLT9_9BACT
MVLGRRILGIGVLAAWGLVAGCGKKADAEIDKKVEKLGEDLANKLILDMTKKQLAEAKTKFAGGEAVSDECSELRKDKLEVSKDKSADAAKLLKEIDVFCQLDVALGHDVAGLKKDYQEMIAAQKKKDRSSEQLYWAGLTTSCTSAKRLLDGLAQDKLENEPKAKELKSQIDQICTPENLARKKYFT